MSAGGFATTPRDSNFIPRLAQVAQVVAELGDAELAARRAAAGAVRRLLGVVGPSACTLGPVAYSVGAMRPLQDRPADAASSFELALERSRAMRARPYEARSQAGLAAALRRARLAMTCAPGSWSARAAAQRASWGMRRLERESSSVALRAADSWRQGFRRVLKKKKKKKKRGKNQRRSRTLAASTPHRSKGPPRHDPRRRAQARAPRHLGRW